MSANTQRRALIGERKVKICPNVKSASSAKILSVISAMFFMSAVIAKKYEGIRANTKINMKFRNRYFNALAM